MPKQVSFGSSGPDVALLQSKLNSRPPTVLPPLTVDGQFGPRTLERVKEFQRNNGLVADGIVGPLTWGKLEEAAPPPVNVPPRRGIDCGCGDGENAGLAQHIRQSFLSETAIGRSFAPTSFASASFAPAGFPLAGLLPSLPSFRAVDGSQQFAVRPFFGLSLDFSCIFISDQTGLNNRPFTVGFPSPFGLATVVMNLGTFTPGLRLLVHELTHAWQSQHARDCTMFMSGSTRCQSTALARNLIEAPTPVHPAFPGNFPFSAYAFKPGKTFPEYNVEQIANQVELNVSPIVSHVKSVAMNVGDPENEACLLVTSIEDRRDPAIVP
jgi:hypothetical protein